jgi:hypothetical protein
MLGRQVRRALQDRKEIPGRPERTAEMASRLLLNFVSFGVGSKEEFPSQPLAAPTRSW